MQNLSGHKYEAGEYRAADLGGMSSGCVAVSHVDTQVWYVHDSHAGTHGKYARRLSYSLAGIPTSSCSLPRVHCQQRAQHHESHDPMTPEYSLALLSPFPSIGKFC